MGAPTNVIVCLTDQLRAFELGCYGNAGIRTPHIDALAQSGVRFDIAVSNNPVCTPARSCLLAGQYSRTCTGCLGNENDESPACERRKFPEPTMAEVFRAAGYRTALIGKWHIGAHPSLVGFDDYVYPKFHHLNKNQVYFDSTGRAFTVEGYAEDFNSGQLAEFLSCRREDQQPFFAFYNIATPHMPYFDIPEPYKTRVRKDAVVLRDNVWRDGELPYDRNWFSIYLWDYLYYQGFFGDEFGSPRVQLPDGFDLKDLTALYWGMISYTDAYVGKMVARLKETGLWDNTLVVFTSDHGDNLGSHHLFNKDKLIEESIRIPMIYHWPERLRPGQNTAQVTQLVDIMPTTLDLCGIDVPAHVQGRSLAAVVRGTELALDNNIAFIETTGKEIGIRTPTHLYGMTLADDLRTVADDRHCFYDLTRDPFEMNNRVPADAETPVAVDLRRQLSAWNARTPWMETDRKSHEKERQERR